MSKEIEQPDTDDLPYDDADEGEDDGWCIDCGDTFRYDDCGGYNPPCSCGMHCRSCHEHELAAHDDDECPECGRYDCDCGAPGADSEPG